MITNYPLKVHLNIKVTLEKNVQHIYEGFFLKQVDRKFQKKAYTFVLNTCIYQITL